MWVQDKSLKKKVRVSEKDCPSFKCYWARPDPGTFNQGIGYRFRSNDYICGTRELRGCPDNPQKRDNKEKK